MSDGLGADGAGTVECDAGIAGNLGAASIGVMGVSSKADQARLSLGWQASSVGWSTSLQLHQGSIVPTPGRMFRVSAIVAGAHGNPAKVVFEALPGSAHPAAGANSMLLIEGDGSHAGGMRFGDSKHTVSMVIQAWSPSETSPNAVTVDWWPGDAVRDYADSGTVHTAHLAVGGSLQVPEAKLRVVQIEAANAEHPGWVVFQPD